MSARPRWEHCVSHRAHAAEAFVRDYFALPDRHVKVIAGAGFDPRSKRFTEMLVSEAKGTVSAIFLREERPAPHGELLSNANKNDEALRKLVPQSILERFIFLPWTMRRLADGRS